MHIKAVLAAIIGASLWFTAAAAQTSPRAGTADFDRWAASELTRLSDLEAVRALMYHYGRGNDELSVRHAALDLGRERAITEYAQAFAPDVRITVYPLRSSTPLRQVTGIEAWTDFAQGFFQNANYSSTLHLMSNFDVTLIDADTATGSAYAGVPHFIRSETARSEATQATTLEYMLCRYAFTARRQADGSWRIAEFTIYLDEIWRAEGFYPGGQANGQ
jgi:hypothetical protein